MNNNNITISKRPIIRVSGYAYGSNTGSTDKGYRFKITEISNEQNIEMITLPMFSLPSACPWIEYTLDVQRQEFGSLYRVEKVRSCFYRIITKPDLIQFMVDTHRVSAEKGGMKETTEPDEYRSFLKKTMKSVPKTIETKNDIKEIANDKILYVVKKLIGPCFRGPIFLSLLRYFDSTFLIRLNGKKILALYALVLAKPYFFCFWDHVGISFGRIRLNGKYLFDMDYDGMYLDPSYCEICSEDMVRQTNGNNTYSVKFPVWTIRRLKDACEDLFIELPAPLEVIRDALQLYLEIEKNAYRYGNTSFSPIQITDNANRIQSGATGGYYDAPPSETLVNTEAIDFLIDNHIMRWCVGDFGRHEWMMKPQAETREIQFAISIQEKIRKITIYNCQYYNQDYTHELFNWISGFSKTENVPIDKMVLCSANSVTARYITNSLGFTFVGVWDAVSIIAGKLKKSNREPLHIIIDRINKVAVDQMNFILKAIHNIDKTIGGGLEKGGAYFHLFGDNEDFSPHSRRGGGDMMNHLMLLGQDFPQVSWDNWNKKDPMYIIYRGLSHPAGIQMSHLHIIQLDKWKTFTEHLKSLDKMAKTDKKDYHIFCSTEEDRKIIMSQIIKKRLGASEEYKKTVFYLGQKIHLMEMDIIGTLERAYLVDHLLERKEVSGKTPMDTISHTYIFIVGDVEYSTDLHTIIHSDVAVISKFPGAPAPRGVFVVGKYTSRRHMYCAVKYCTKDMKIFVIPDVNLNAIKDGNVRPINCDLINKLTKIKLYDKNNGRRLPTLAQIT